MVVGGKQDTSAQWKRGGKSSGRNLAAVWLIWWLWFYFFVVVRVLRGSRQCDVCVRKLFTPREVDLGTSRCRPLGTLRCRPLGLAGILEKDVLPLASKCGSPS